MNQFEQRHKKDRRHPVIKIMESILSKDNSKGEELRNVIQNAESYTEIKQYISKEKIIQGANDAKFYAQILILGLICCVKDIQICHNYVILEYIEK
jgi:hypothetical protein